MGWLGFYFLSCCGFALLCLPCFLNILLLSSTFFDFLQDALSPDLVKRRLAVNMAALEDKLANLKVVVDVDGD